MRGNQFSAALAVWALLCGCSPKTEGPAAGPVPAPPASAPLRLQKLALLPLQEQAARADVPVLLRLEATPPIPTDYPTVWLFSSAGGKFEKIGRGATLETTFPSGGKFSVQAAAGGISSNLLEISVVRVGLVDAEERPIREARLALLTREAFDEKGRLRDSAEAASPDRVRVLVEDPNAGAPASVTIGTLTLPLMGSGERRVTRSILLLGDADDAAAGTGAVLHTAPGARLDFHYRGLAAGGVAVGPAVVHAIPVRFFAVGPGLPPTPEIEKAVALRLAQANAVWAPFGRRFLRSSLVRLDAFQGLFLIRGRAAGADGQGRPSKCGVRIDGREIAVPGTWRSDGAPMSPKSTAQALMALGRASFRFDLLDGLLAGDREAVVVRVRRPDGSPAAVEMLSEGSDVSQALTPLPGSLLDGIEVTPSPALMSLEEVALLASAKASPSGGIDVFIVTWIHSLKSARTYKVYPQGILPSSLAGSAVLSWPLLDGSGRFPYGLARVAGELLLPQGMLPGPDDTLFADPLSEAPGVDGRKRVTARTAAGIAERGRGLSGKK
ncbi:MAG: hypothetical protein HY293_00220 [Planctomycetes bacterium]|nr:hypothetical protein [Planctomycetota bacterium]